MGKRLAVLALLLSISTTPLHGKLVGDFNDDGKINIFDLIEFIGYLGGKRYIPEMGHEISDVIVDTVAVTDTIFLTEEGLRSAKEPLWGFWYGKCTYLDYLDRDVLRESVYIFQIENKMFLNERDIDVFGEHVFGWHESDYNYDVLTGLITFSWNDYPVKEMITYRGGNSFDYNGVTYTKLDTLPAWALK